MPDPTKIRALLQNGGTEVRILMAHEMESGQRSDQGGEVVSAWYITQVMMWRNERPVLKAAWGPGVSKNPFLSVRLQGGQSGDVLRVMWWDNRGASRSDSIRVP